MNPLRASGILLHPTSLPGRFGIGDLGPQAYRFVDFLAAAGQRLWQVLPLGPTAYGDSPYQCFSAFAGNPLLVCPELLVSVGLLPADALDQAPAFPGARVDYGPVIEFKAALLGRAFAHFKTAPDARVEELFAAFRERSAPWLDDYALFRVLKTAHGGQAWNAWAPEVARRDPEALADARATYASAVEAEAFAQFLFFQQWSSLKKYANERDIRIVGDVPIFVAYDSTDVWARPELFKLDAEGNPTVVAGVPPDYFSETGQLWGNPIYDWDLMRETGFGWWVDRVRSGLGLFDMLRFDHFRGFAACWEIPAGAETAIEGEWVETPGRELFTVLKREIGNLAIIAEDLGVITPDVEALRDDFGFPGMHVLQFAFGDTSDVVHLPHNHRPNGVVYTGTHDNDTTVGWFTALQTGAEAETSDEDDVENVAARMRDHCLEYLNTDAANIHWKFIRAAFASVADSAVVPLQDVLGLGSDARMNLPASTSGNWNWRFEDGLLTEELASALRYLADLYGRIPVPKKPEAETSTSPVNPLRKAKPQQAGKPESQQAGKPATQ